MGVQARIGASIGSVALENGDVRRTLSLASAFDEAWPLEYVAGNPKYDVFAEPDFSWLQRLPEYRARECGAAPIDTAV